MMDRKDKERLKTKIVDLVTYAGKKRQKPSTGKKPKEGKKRKPDDPQGINVKGDGNIIGNNNTYVRTEKLTHNVTAEVRPGEEHITEEQAAAIKRMVNQIVELEAVTKRNPKSHQAVYGALNNRFKVTRYRLHKREKWPEIESYLRQWIGRLSSTASAKRSAPDWRKSKYSYIKINVRQLGLEDKLNELLLSRYGVASIKDLSDDDLEVVYRTVAGWKQRSK